MSERYGSRTRETVGREATPDAVSERRGTSGVHDHHEGGGSNDHLASIYESQEDQFEAVVPFIQRGLERGERCLYVADDNTTEEILDAFRDGGIDVEAARESGALSIHTKADTYLRTGEFDQDAMLDFWQETLVEARDEEGYEGVRAAAEMTWALDEGTGLDRLVQYEAMLNTIYPGEDYTVLCQYNRERFPADVISDVIRSHPLVVYDGTICQNFYYHPPDEFFDTDHPSLDVDKTVEGLVSRARTEHALQERERYQRELYEITSNPDLPFEEKLDALFELGCERFDLDLGALNRVDPDADRLEVEYASGDHDHFEPGAELPLSQTYCQAATDIRAAASVSNPAEEGFDDILVYEDYGVGGYLGTYIPVDGDADRTLAFVPDGSEVRQFSEQDRTYLELMGQWVGHELNRRQRERELRERKQHLSAIVETTPECIKTVAADGTLLQMNPAGLDMVEADSASDVIGECIYDLIAPEHREAFREFNEKICRGESGTLEFDIVGLQGTRRHMETHAAPLRSSDGTISHVALTRDVTERKEREAALRRTKNRFETVFENSNDAIFLLDPDVDELVDANPAAVDLVGYDREELLTHGPSDLHPDEMDQFRTFVDDVFEEGYGWTDELTCRTKDGEDLPAEISASALELEDRSLMLAHVRDITERKKHERCQRELYEIAADIDRSFEEKLDALFELGCARFGLELGGMARIDPDRDHFEVEYVSDDHDHLAPGATVALSETYCRVLAHDGATAGVTDPVESGFEGTAAHEQFGVNAYLGTRIEVDGDLDRTLFFVSSEPRDEPFTDAEYTFHRLMGQWVGHELERERRADQLAALNEMSRELTNAETIAEIADDVIGHARETLRLPVTALVHYDGQQGALAPAAQTPRAGDELPMATLCEPESGPLWRAFVANEVRLLDDVASLTGASDDLTEVVAVPLERQGLFVTATRAADGFSSAELDFVRTTAATVKAACTRADREQLLHDRERTLEEQNETLERLNRVNDIIRNIDKALVRASTRAEIESVVCEQLADVGPYELAWIGEHDPVTDEIAPREWAGTEKGYLDEITVTADDRPEGQGPGGRAVRTREPQVVNDILDDPTFKPYRQAALNHGYHAHVALPLVYEGSLYGILNVYASQPGVFEDLERSVLTELSDNIAYAINAVERKKALVGDTITELKFDLGDTDTAIVSLSSQLDCTITLESVIPQADGQLRIFFSTRGVCPSTFAEAATRMPVTDLSLISEHEDDGEAVGLFEALLTDGSLYATILEHGGIPREIAVGDEEAYVLVELAGDAATREFVEMFRTNNPGATLVAQRTHERSHRSTIDLYASLTGALTDRQLEVLQTAYFSGYFEKPRTRTGSEIASTLDITQPTFNHHVRAAQRKLFRSLFEDEESLEVASRGAN